MTCTLAAIILTFLTPMNYFVGGRRVLYPPFAFSLIWCADTYLYMLSLIEMDKIHSITWWVVVLGAICFSVGSWIAGKAPKRLFEFRMSDLRDSAASNLGKHLLIILCVLALPFLFHEIAGLGAGGTLGLLANARQATTNIANSGETLRAYPAITYLPAFAVWIAILFFIERADRCFKVAVVLALVCCLLATGRTLFLLLFSALVYVQLFRQNNGSVRSAFKIAIVPMLLFVSIFIGVIFINKDLTSFTGGAGAFFSYLVLGYILGPLGALDYVLTHAAQYTSVPNHTFEFFLKAFSLIPGVSFKAPPIIQSFVFVPFPANVYTAYKPFFTDFGFWGMLIAIAVIGFIQTLIYRKALEGGKIALFFSAILMYATLMCIFDDAYTDFQQFFLMLLLLIFYYGVLNRLTLGLKVRPLSHLGSQLPRFRIW